MTMNPERRTSNSFQNCRGEHDFQQGSLHLNQPSRQRQLRYDIECGEGCKTVIRPKHFSEWGIYYNDENKFEVMLFIDKFEGFMRCQQANQYQYRWYFEQVINSKEAIYWKSISSTIEDYISYRDSFVNTMWSHAEQDSIPYHFLKLEMDNASSVKLASELFRWYEIFADTYMDDEKVIDYIFMRIPKDLRYNFSTSCRKNRKKFEKTLHEMTLHEEYVDSPYR